MYQHFQFNRDEIARAAENIAAVLAESQPDENPERFAATVIAGRLRKTPGSYLQYGPYWWAVKHALRSADHGFGATDNVTLRAAYGGGMTAHQVFAAGEQFRDHYRANLMAGTATFALGGQDETDEGRYTLFDIDMEVLRQGLGSVAATDVGETQTIHEPDEPILFPKGRDAR